MQQHSVPQNVTTYKFRLVGNMTLKQFLELAVGGVLAWLIFSSNLNFLFKWTLGPFFGLLGFALAFIPFEDRPLDQWILNFLKSIYSPTQFIWKPSFKQIDFLAPSKPLPVPTKISAPQSKNLEEYLQSLPQIPSTAFEKAESKYLVHITNLFGALGTKVPPLKKSIPQPKTPISPLIKGIRIRKLMHPQMCLLPHITVYKSPPEPKLAVMPDVLKTTPAKPKTTTAPKTISKPKSSPRPKKTIPLKPSAPPPPPTPTTNVSFAKDVIIPQFSQKPNLISGITLDKAGKIIPSTILEIKDAKNHPVRALKSNKLGQFFIATPLTDGIYAITAEHPDYRFAIMKLEAKNEVIPPLKIQALN